MGEMGERVTTEQIHEKLDAAAELKDKGDPSARDAMQGAIDLSAIANRQADAQITADLEGTAGHPSHETVVDVAVRQQGLLGKLFGRKPR